VGIWEQGHVLGVVEWMVVDSSYGMAGKLFSVSDSSGLFAFRKRLWLFIGSKVS